MYICARAREVGNTCWILLLYCYLSTSFVLEGARLVTLRTSTQRNATAVLETRCLAATVRFFLVYIDLLIERNPPSVSLLALALPWDPQPSNSEVGDIS